MYIYIIKTQKIIVHAWTYRKRHIYEHAVAPHALTIVHISGT